MPAYLFICYLFYQYCEHFLYILRENNINEENNDNLYTLSLWVFGCVVPYLYYIMRNNDVFLWVRAFYVVASAFFSLLRANVRQTTAMTTTAMTYRVDAVCVQGWGASMCETFFLLCGHNLHYLLFFRISRRQCSASCASFFSLSIIKPDILSIHKYNKVTRETN